MERCRRLDFCNMYLPVHVKVSGEPDLFMKPDVYYEYSTAVTSMNELNGKCHI